MRLPRSLEIGTALVTALLVGCSTGSFGATMFGIRPDLPPYGLTNEPCKDLKVVYDHSADLEQAYRTRASFNRNAIWFAGVLALATIAATGGLAAAGAASLSIALISVSGAFAAGSFGLAHNDALATAYTKAANKVALALKDVHRDYTDPTHSSDCSTEMTTLSGKVTAAANDLEQDRTDSALAAKQEIDNAVATAIAKTPSPN